MSPAKQMGHINLDQLYQPFLEKLLGVVAACLARGWDYRAYSGYRTPAQQAALWAQGRTQSGTIHTDAGPLESPHCFGLACDFFHCVDGKEDWQPKSYAVLGEEAERAGLVWGGRFTDRDHDHVQWPGYVTGRQCQPLKTTYLLHPDAPLSAVFEFLNAKEKHT